MPESLQVHLCAEIEMVDRDACIVRNIRRVNTNESPLLPTLNLTIRDGKWVHSEEGKESNISRAIGEGINKYLKQLSKSRDEMKGK